MFKTFLISTRRLLVPRPLTSLSISPGVSASGSTTIYDVRRRSYDKEYHSPRGILLPLTHRLHPCSLLGNSTLLLEKQIRWASDSKKEFKIPDPAVIACNMINMLKCVDLNDLKDAPAPAFWTAIVVGGSQLVFPFLEIIGGYSSVLTMYQLYAAALTVSFSAGKKWGLALSENPDPKPTWETMRWCLLPSAVALTGLLTPYPIGFLLVGSSMITSLYLDLTSCAYPPWACAIVVFMTLTTIIGLFLALSAYVLFHNGENKEKKKKKEQEQVGNDNGEDEEETDVKAKKPPTAV